MAEPERSVICLRYGLDGDAEPQSYAAIGRRLSSTPMSSAASSAGAQAAADAQRCRRSPGGVSNTHDVVVAGHICLDLIPRLRGVPALDPGALTVVGPAVVSTGGAVGNTGLALHRLGTPVAMMGKLGTDPLGRVVLDLLAQHDPSLCDEMIVSDTAATSYTIVINPPATDRSFLHCPAANDTFSAADVRYDRLHGARVFHFGYPPLMRKMYEDGGAELLRDVSSGARGRTGHLAGPLRTRRGQRRRPCRLGSCSAHTLPHVDVIHPSIDELLFMLDRAAHDAWQAGAAMSNVIDLPRLVRARRPAARDGCGGRRDQARRPRSVCPDDRHRRPAASVLRSDRAERRAVAGPTGPVSLFRATERRRHDRRGDCTIAGFLAALLRDEDPSTAARSATAVGAFSVESVDATGG